MSICSALLSKSDVKMEDTSMHVEKEHQYRLHSSASDINKEFASMSEEDEQEGGPPRANGEEEEEGQEGGTTTENGEKEEEQQFCGPTKANA
jgi:hypothetical protein